MNAEQTTYTKHICNFLQPCAIESSLDKMIWPGYEQGPICYQRKSHQKQRAGRKRGRPGRGIEEVTSCPSRSRATAHEHWHGFDDYVLSKTKSLRKGMFSGKLGKITVSAAQTGALVLPSPASSSNTPATMATVNLRFDPHEASSEPPRLGGLTTKIRVSTFFAARPAQEFPNRFTMNLNSRVLVGFMRHLSLSLLAVLKQQPGRSNSKTRTERRNSDSSTCSSESDSDLPVQKDNKSYYSSTILVPITLPHRRHGFHLSIPASSLEFTPSIFL